MRPGYLSPDFVSETSSYRSMSPDRDTVEDDDDDDPDVDVESNRGGEDEDPIRTSPRGSRRESPAPEALEESQEKVPPRSPAIASPEDSAHTGSSDEGRLTRDGSPIHHVRWHSNLS